MTMGLSMDLDEATKIATRDMLDWIVDMKGLSREDAYMLASAAMDLVVTQVVDGTKGIHALMPKSIFRKNRRRAHTRTREFDNLGVQVCAQRLAARVTLLRCNSS